MRHNARMGRVAAHIERPLDHRNSSWSGSRRQCHSLLFVPLQFHCHPPCQKPSNWLSRGRPLCLPPGCKSRRASLDWQETLVRLEPGELRVWDFADEWPSPAANPALARLPLKIPLYPATMTRPSARHEPQGNHSRPRHRGSCRETDRHLRRWSCPSLVDTTRTLGAECPAMGVHMGGRTRRLYASAFRLRWWSWCGAGRRLRNWLRSSPTTAKPAKRPRPSAASKWSGVSSASRRRRWFD